MAQAVIDTNILVSALLRADSLPGAVVRDIVRQRLEPVVCEETMAEYADVLLRPRFGFDAADVRELIALIGQLAVWVHITPYPETLALPDPSDWPFVACALAASCPVVTGNVRHFPKTLGVRVMTVREWVDRVS
jgi:putative PIN family toxin of toxin-antitoxin system